MTVDDARLRARRELEEIGLSMESASYLLDDQPPGGWDSLVTKEELRAEMAGLRAELHQELRAQTWRLATALLVTITLMTAIIRVT
jgi:hypothetical protein